MTPPKASDQGKDCASDIASAVFVCAGAIQTLTKRADFLRASSARRMGTGSFLLQARARGDDTAAIRIGFTASKKIGNAVARNRAKRRMRALVRAVLPDLGRAGWDYVLVAKPQATITRDYADMLADLTRALGQIHSDKVRP
ncbi:MAG: ribonuclease P protein component [Cypionkella sp.]|nr:ribonuclease P protein component [Cypionkella sp.]